MESHKTPDGLRCNTLRRIAVFCGASSGNGPEYLECARLLGEEMVKRGIGLVYGG
jgi:predicted Rossmann-fold nucleotide-binding protein